MYQSNFSWVLETHLDNHINLFIFMVKNLGCYIKKHTKKLSGSLTPSLTQKFTHMNGLFREVNLSDLARRPRSTFSFREAYDVDACDVDVPRAIQMSRLKDEWDASNVSLCCVAVCVRE